MVAGSGNTATIVGVVVGVGGAIVILVLLVLLLLYMRRRRKSRGPDRNMPEKPFYAVSLYTCIIWWLGLKKNNRDSYNGAKKNEGQ